MNCFRCQKGSNTVPTLSASAENKFAEEPDIKRVTMILGDEYDEVLRNALRTVLVENGAIGVDKSWCLGGSQEIERIQARIGEHLITIESETFVGLTITGAKSVIEKIADQVSKKTR